MKRKIEIEVESFMRGYCEKNGLEFIWRTPSVRYAAAGHPEFPDLKKLVVENHFLPEDFLANPTVVISYFLPFIDAVATSNIDGYWTSDEWARAYNVTNEMAVHLNEHLVKVVKELGFRAAVPHSAGMMEDVLKSRWSQRHIARLAGHGTFGINNMLITEQGCTGRFFSVVADLPVSAGSVVAGERCLYKRNGTCGVCVRRCVADALTPQGFDRWKCHEMCASNAKAGKEADVCGKCVVNLPCSFSAP